MDVPSNVGINVYVYMLYILVPHFHLYCKIVFLFACMLVLVAFVFSISYVTNLALWLREFNKLTYLLTKWIDAAAQRCCAQCFISSAEQLDLQEPIIPTILDCLLINEYNKQMKNFSASSVLIAHCAYGITVVVAMKNSAKSHSCTCRSSNVLAQYCTCTMDSRFTLLYRPLRKKMRNGSVRTGPLL